MRTGTTLRMSCCSAWRKCKNPEAPPVRRKAEEPPTTDSKCDPTGAGRGSNDEADHCRRGLAAALVCADAARAVSKNCVG